MFIRIDPIEPNGKEVLSLHKRLYANANPVHFADPRGTTADATSVTSTAAISSGLISRLVVAGFNVYFRTGPLVLYTTAALPAISLALEGVATGLEIIENIAERWSKPIHIPAGPAPRGLVLGEAARQNLANSFPKIDHFEKGWGISIRTHEYVDPKQLLKAIEADLADLKNVQRETLPGRLADGGEIVIRPGMIQQKGLIVGVRAAAIEVAEDGQFLRQVAQLARQARTVIRVIPVRSWR